MSATPEAKDVTIPMDGRYLVVVYSCAKHGPLVARMCALGQGVTFMPTVANLCVKCGAPVLYTVEQKTARQPNAEILPREMPTQPEGTKGKQP